MIDAFWRLILATFPKPKVLKDKTRYFKKREKKWKIKI